MSSNPVRIAVFNDTSCGQHFGCDAVMEAISRLVAEHRGVISYRHPVGQAWQNHETALAALDKATVVLVNGEGTIHHSNEKARALAALGPHCVTRARPCYLINATVQANDAAIMADIAAFTAVWVRETSSQKELVRYGVEANVCGDLSLFHEHEASARVRGQPLVVDSVNKRVNIWLSDVAHDLGADFVSMKKGGDGPLVYAPRTRLARLLRRKPKPTGSLPRITDFREFASYLAAHSYLVTGRFHGFCLGLALSLPMSVVPSNTWKCEAVLRDVGLDPRRLVAPWGKVPILPLTDQEVQRMRDYVARARTDMRAMFNRLMSA